MADVAQAGNSNDLMNRNAQMGGPAGGAGLKASQLAYAVPPAAIGATKNAGTTLLAKALKAILPKLA